MDDYISRAEAVKAAMADASPKRTHDFNAGCARAANNVNAIPAADVRPVVRGKWISDESGCVWCSNCGEEHEWVTYRASFCDNCGADMRREEEL